MEGDKLTISKTKRTLLQEKTENFMMSGEFFLFK